MNKTSVAQPVTGQMRWQAINPQTGRALDIDATGSEEMVFWMSLGYIVAVDVWNGECYENTCRYCPEDM